MFVLIGNLVGGAAGLGFGLFAGSQSKKDAQRASQAAQYAAGQQVEGLNNAIGTRQAGTADSLNYLKLLDPFINSGAGANNQLAAALGAAGPDAQRSFYDNFQNDPGYNATLKAGTNAIEGSQSASGSLRSGGTLKALQDYGMRFQQSIFGDRLNRLAGLSSSGQGAATTSAVTGAGITDRGASDVAGYMRDIGTVNAGGTINSSNALSKGNQNYLSALGYGVGQMKPAINDLGGMLTKQFGFA